ncbi:MAG: hypothetical protein NTU56_11330 [Proteobacteria bacterium]|jgi:hypothetical protein|nr:hypothetical protein [Pseudomonadota bacterium]
MTRRKDAVPTRPTPTLRTSHAEHGKPARPTSGRVAFDERGNAVWEMRTSEHQYVRDASTTLVRKLVPPLSIEATAIVKGPSDTPVPKRAVPLDTGRPNDRAQMGTVRTFPVRSSSPAVKRPASKAMVTSRARPGLLDRLFSRKP